MTSDDCGRLRGSVCLAAPALNRRHLLLGGSAALTAMTAQTACAAEQAVLPEKMPIQAGDRIRIVTGELKNSLVAPETLAVAGDPVTGYPFDPANDILRRGTRLNRLLVIRLDPEEMDAETQARTVNGVLAFSAVCTHRGCTISHWEPADRNFRCHCHLSAFSILTAGSVANGPAQRQLAMVPLGIDDDGFVVATGGFTGEVGGSKT